MQNNRQYDKEYKVQSVKLAKEIGSKRDAEKLEMSYHTLSGWVHK